LILLRHLYLLIDNSDNDIVNHPALTPAQHAVFTKLQI
jgi:hypothetical protein